MTPETMSAWLAARSRVLDGAMGSELVRRGVASAARLWGVGALLDDPGAIRAVHQAHAFAGAEALTAVTFRVAPYSLRQHGLGDHAGILAKQAVELARAEAGAGERPALVLASQTTLEDCYRPDLVPGPAVLDAEHAATATLLAAAKPDGLLLETFNTIREAEAAAVAAVETGLAVIVAFACRSGGRLLSGEDVREAVARTAIPGVVAVGVNCTAVADVEIALERMASSTALPLVAYANDAWFATDSSWLAAAPVEPTAYARRAVRWSELGARLIGGCCGTASAHISAVSRALADARRPIDDGPG